MNENTFNHHGVHLLNYIILCTVCLTNDSSSQYGGMGCKEADCTAEYGCGGRGGAATSQDAQCSLQQARLYSHLR